MTSAPSSPRMPSSGRACWMSRCSSSSERRSMTVTTSVSLDFVAATPMRSGRSSRMKRDASVATSMQSLSSSSTLTPSGSAGVVWGRHRRPQSLPHRAGRAWRRLGQQPGAHTEGIRPSNCGTSSPRASAARSSRASTRSRTNDGVGADGRDADVGQTQLVGRRLRLGVEVVDDLHVVADEPDGRRDDGADPGGRELAHAVVDVGLEPRLGRRPRARAEDELARQVAPEDAVRLLRQPGREREVLALVEVALTVARPRRVVHGVGDGVRDEEQRDLGVRGAVEGAERPRRAHRRWPPRSPGRGAYCATLSICSSMPSSATAAAASARFSRYCRHDE